MLLLKKILILCSGVGHVARGFESFATQLAAHYSVRARPGSAWQATLGFSGPLAPPLPTEQLLPLPAPSRNSGVCRIAGCAVGRSPYFIEQFLCAIRSLGYLSEYDVVLTSDGTIANVLWWIRQKLRLSYRVIFSNGAPFPPPYPKCDLVHHVSEPSLAEALSAGMSSLHHRYVPYGFDAPSALPTAEMRQAVRTELAIPSHTVLIACIAAIGVNHKRLEYLINETAQHPTAHLLLIGEKDSGCNDIITLLGERLSGRFSIRTALQHSEAMRFLAAADRLVLTSLTEGFGRVVVEAAMLGVPPVIHDSVMNRSLFTGIAQLLPFEKPGQLTQFLNTTCNDITATARDALSRETIKRFSWSSLEAEYESMFTHPSTLGDI